MIFNIDSMDDPIIQDGAKSFAGGQVSNLRANQLDPTQWAQLLNVEIARNGTGTTRRGTVQLGAAAVSAGPTIQGLFYYDTPSNAYLVAVNNAKLYKWASPNWTQIATGWTGTDTSVQYSLAQGVLKLFWTDGIGHLQSWDGTTLTDEGAADTNTDPPRAAKSIVWFTSRLIAAGVATDPDGVYFSNFLEAGAGKWNRTTQQLRVGAGEGDPITGLCAWLDDNLVVLKRRSIWLVNCDPQASAAASGGVSVLDIKPIHKKIGCPAPKTAVQVGSDILVLTDSGVRSVQRTIAAETQSQIGPPVSEPIQDIIDRINLSAIGTSYATFWNNHYFLALPLDSATSPNTVAVFNALTSTWMGTWTGWLPSAFGVRSDSGITKMVIGHFGGKVADWMDYVSPLAEVDATFQDMGVAIATSALSRALNFGEVSCPKSGLNTEFEFNNSSADCTIYSVIDDAVTASLYEGPFATYGAQVLLPQILPFNLPNAAGIIRKSFDAQRLGQFREIQYQITSTSKKLVISQFSMSGFNDTAVLQTA